MPMDPAERQVYEHAAADLGMAVSRRERGEIVHRVAGVLGVSEKTVWRNLQEVGWESGRKARIDKGQSVVTSEHLRELARMIAQNTNKWGEPNTSTKEAWRIATEEGMGAGQASYGHVGRRMREEGYDVTRMRAAEPSIPRVSDYPNQVWFFDPSVAIQWYFRDENGKKLDLYMDAGARFYPGKHENFKALRRVIYRYLVVDHFSGAFYIQYFYSPGERFEDVADFLFKAMSQKDAELGDSYPFRGLPRWLCADQGPAFKNGLIQNLLGEKGLGILVQMHEPGNAKASGAVEKLHDIWQRTFEGRLALRGAARDLEELNALALRWCAKMNAEREHTRTKRTRMAAWSTITPEHLVECPDRRTFFRLISSAPITATLDAHLWIQHNSRKWQLRGENLYPGQKVEIREAPFSDVGIRAWDDQGRELAATLLEFDKVSGFVLNGRRQVWDSVEDKGATAPIPAAQQVARALKKGEERVVIPDALEAADLPSFMAPREGRAWTPPADSPVYQEPLIGSLDAREEISQRLGRPLGDDGAWWRERIGTGVTRSHLEDLWTEFTAPAEVVSDVG